jgi:hypothetical protein
MSVRIDLHEQIAWVDLGEAAAPDEIRDRLVELFAHPDYSTTLDVIYDCRQADLSAISAGALRDLAGFLAARDYRPRRSAMVVSRDVDYGVARMWAVYAKPGPTEREVFRNIAETRDWILSDRN